MFVFPFRSRTGRRRVVGSLASLIALCLAPHAQAGLTFDEASRLAREQAPALLAQQSALAGARSLQGSAATLPDPRLIVGVDNLPVTGPDRYSLTRDFMTMQRIGLMQEVPNRAKREAREAGAQARVERERAMLAVVQLAVQRDAALGWLATYYAERRVAQLAELRAREPIAAGHAGRPHRRRPRDARRTHDGAPGGAGAGRPPRRRAA